MQWNFQSSSQVHTQDFSLAGGGGGADPEVMQAYNLCLILKIML
jgi:hypothetical protein